MSYEYGNWYCKPANEADAKEIVERAVASGAELGDRPGCALLDMTHNWDYFCFWGVYEGVTHTGHKVDGGTFGDATEYTIAELRQKFPLPGEQAEEPKQWREKWVGDALSLDCEPNKGTLSRKDFVGAMYDAMQSGQLKAPEAAALRVAKH